MVLGGNVGMTVTAMLPCDSPSAFETLNHPASEVAKILCRGCAKCAKPSKRNSDFSFTPLLWSKFRVTP